MPEPDDPDRMDLTVDAGATRAYGRLQGEALVHAEAAVAHAWNVGDVILDLYEVRGVLGEGGMGRVYRVHHRGWAVDLAVKSPKAEAIGTEAGKEAFAREARTWVDLGLHPHVVSCYYVRTLGGIPRVFAECVEGGSLADWVRDGRLYEGGEKEALGRILDVAIQMAWGLECAHEKGFVHRDVKPANVLVTPEGVAKVTDFGLARAADPEAARSGKRGLESVGQMTPAFCSPEQARGEPLSKVTDVWSWAVSVLAMFTGGVTWRDGRLAAEALAEYLAPESTSDGPAPMPKSVRALLERCLTVDPSQRLASLKEVAATLRDIYRMEIEREHPWPAPKAASLGVDALNNRALSFLDLGQEEEAEHAWEEALALDPLHPESTYNQALVAWERNAITDADVVGRLNRVRHNTGRADLLGLVHLARGDAPAAEEALKAAIETPLAGPEVWTAYGEALLALGQFRQAAAVYDRAAAKGAAPDVVERRGALVRAGKKISLLPTQAMQRSRGHLLRTFPRSLGFGNIVFSPSGALVVAAGRGKGGGLEAHDIRSGERIARLELDKSETWHLPSLHETDGGPTCTSYRPFDQGGEISCWDLAKGVRVFRGKPDLESVLGGKDSAGTRYVWIDPRGTQALTETRQKRKGTHDEDTTVARWDLSTGRCLSRFDLPSHGSASWSRDCSVFLLKARDGSVSLWDARTGSRRRYIEADDCRDYYLSPDGHLAVLVGKETLRAWDLVSDKCLGPLARGSREYVPRFSPDGRFVFFDDSLWQPRQDRVVKIPGSQLAVAFSRDGKHLLLSGREDLQYWDTEKGVLLDRFREPGTHAMAFSPDGRFAVSQSRNEEDADGRSARLRLWDLGSSQPSPWRRLVVSRPRTSAEALASDAVFQQHLDAARAALSLGDAPKAWLELCQGRVLGNHDRDPAVLSMATELARWLPRRRLRGAWPHRRWEGDAVRGGAPRRDGGLAFLQEIPDRSGPFPVTSSIKLRDADSGAVLGGCSVPVSEEGAPEWLPLPGSDRAVANRWIREGPRVLRVLEVWDLVKGQPLSRFNARWSEVATWTVSADGRLGLFGDEIRRIILWDVESGQQRLELVDHEGAITALAFAPGGAVAASGSEDQSICVWDLRGGERLRLLEGHQGAITALAFGEPPLLASGGADHTIRLWDLRSGTHRVLAAGEGAISSLAVGAEGRFLLSASTDRNLCLWDLIDGTCVWRIEALSSCQVWSWDGRFTFATVPHWNSASRESVPRGDLWQLDWDLDADHPRPRKESLAPSDWEPGSVAPDTHVRLNPATAIEVKITRGSPYAKKLEGPDTFILTPDQPSAELTATRLRAVLSNRGPWVVLERIGPSIRVDNSVDRHPFDRAHGLREGSVGRDWEIEIRIRVLE